MSGVKHTLRIEDGANSHFFDGRILDQDDECLAFVDIHHPMSAIFAAAPDLLSVAKLALKTILDEAEARDFDPPADTNLVADLEAAITRATGDRPEKGGAL